MTVLATCQALDCQAAGEFVDYLPIGDDGPFEFLDGDWYCARCAPRIEAELAAAVAEPLLWAGDQA